jgi:SAM-dependent methyltransferase
VPVGIDVSEAAVRRARRRLPGVEVHQASAERLPLPDASADKAVSLNSLYFWPDFEQALREQARVLRPGGLLLLAFEPAEELRKYPGHVHGFRLFEVAEVRALMEQAGFVATEETWGTGRKPDRFCCLSARRIGANG